jgi:DNA-binding CsgD family transcriptional regulator
VTALLASLGSLGLVGYSSLPYPNDMTALFVLATVVFSAGNAMLLIMWGEFWSTLATQHAARYLFAAYAFAFVLYFAVGVLPHLLGGVVTSLFPAVSAALLFASRNEPRRCPSQIDFEIEEFNPVRAVVAAFCFGAVHGFAQRFLNVSGAMTATTSAYALLIAGLGIALLVVYLVVRASPNEVLSLYRPTIPAFAGGLILLALLPDELAFVGDGLVLFAIYSIDMLVMMVSTDIAFRTRRPVALCFGVGIFAMRAGTTVASALVYVVVGMQMIPASMQDVAYLVGAMLVVAVGSMVFSQLDLVRLYKPKPPARVADNIAESCADIACACKLTARETEVFLLLAVGRNIPFIATELSIAESTVKHHVGSIYRKIGVYDRQGLVDVALAGVAGRGAS